MSETARRRGGRPRIDATPITVRVPPSLLAKIDALRAKSPGMSRPEAIRQLIEMTLDALDGRIGS